MKNNKLFFSVLFVSAMALTACGPAAYAGGGTVAQPVTQPVAQQQVVQSPVPQISVVGSGMVYVTPDVAQINVGVRSQADTVAEALELNNAQAIAIKNTLVAKGVDEKNIQTASFNVYPQSDYGFQGEVTNTYYVVENNVYVTVKKLSALGEILDAVAKSGANNIYGITFDAQNKTSAQTEARGLAVNSARAQALELAAAAGVELGDIISISTFSSYAYPNYGMGGGGAAPAYAEMVPIAAGQMQVNAEVTVVFAIQ